MVQACATVDRLSERAWTASAAGMIALLLMLVLSSARGPYAPAEPPPLDDADPLVLTLGPDGRDLRFHGDFEDGAAERVRAILAANPRIERIHLTSDGGLVDEARAIGALIAARGLATYVPDTCVSACTLAFVSGRARFIVPEAKLGFHAPFETDEAGREVQVDSTEERRDYAAAGLAPDFIDAALGTPSAQIWFPDADRLRGAGVVTDVVDTGRFPDSTLDAGATPTRARNAVLRNVPLLDAFGPGSTVVDEIATWYLAGYRTGRSEADAFAGLRAMTARAVRDVLAKADAETMTGFGHLIVAALDATADPDRCAEIGRPSDAVAVDEALRGSGQTRSGDRLVALLRDAGAGRAIHVAAREVDAPLRADEEAVDCTALRARYADALARPSGPRLLGLLLGSAPSEAPRLEASARITSR